LTEKSKLFKNITDFAIRKLRENPFDYIPITFFIEDLDFSNNKSYAKAMIPFSNAFYGLESKKKKTIKYYKKLQLLEM
jgi:hypothetical protein